VLDLVRKASQISGVLRIALIGSLTTNKSKPKDADLLITVTDEMDLAPLAKLGRKFSGHEQNFNEGGEIFHLALLRLKRIHCGKLFRRSAERKYCRSPGIFRKTFQIRSTLPRISFVRSHIRGDEKARAGAVKRSHFFSLEFLHKM
jgi:hypothetical protein